MKPEELARQDIDKVLQEAGWVVQDRKRLNLGAGYGVAVREFSLTTGATDYLLFVDRKAVGVIEAKKVGHALTGVEEQSNKYRHGLPDDLPAERLPLPFAFETNSIETHFTSYLDPVPRSRPTFAFFQPQTLQLWLTQAPENVPTEQNQTLRARLRSLPQLHRLRLRECQIEAITRLEQSLAENRPRALIQMATGSGKTYTAVSSIYRLIKFGGAKRILFLVDRANLARQTIHEFQQYETPDDGRKFTQLYNVQHLESNVIDTTAKVCITTIQRLYSILRGEPELDPALEEQSLFDTNEEVNDEPVKEVHYNPQVPIETFDFIFTDECHRSIYGKWSGVLDYFDSYVVGLTATPNKQTFGFFNQNLVMEYGHDRAVADGVNVDYQVYRIQTEISQQGSVIEATSFVGKRERRTRATRWVQTEDDVSYDAAALDRQVMAPDQIRKVIATYRDALPRIFPGRVDPDDPTKNVPKTLIFAKDDNHADEIVRIVREEFAQGNAFAQKITYKTTGAKPEELIASFRNSYNPRITVTVDMIATGTDIKPLEVLLFMRSVKSRGLFEQMKGRGSRVIQDSEFHNVTPTRESKTRFIIVDAVGVCERIKTDEPPLERKASIPLKKILDDVAIGKWRKDADLLPTLVGRLGRLAKSAKPDEQFAITQLSGGRSIHQLASNILQALDVDRQLAVTQQETGQTYLTPDDPPVLQTAQRLIQEALLPFDDPDLRDALLKTQERDELTIDIVSQDRVLVSDWDIQAEDKARTMISSFRDFLDQNRDEIAALQVFYNRPRHARLKYEDVEQLAAALERSRLGLTTDKLWQAYELLDNGRVRDTQEQGKKIGKSKKTQRMLTDPIALVRYTLVHDSDEAATLEPYSVTVQRRFADWLAEQETLQGHSFTPEQRQWLELICDAIAASVTIEVSDFDSTPFVQKGGLGKAHQLFGSDFNAILEELNERLAA
jgi:type I restriction enzyme R subunit